MPRCTSWVAHVIQPTIRLVMLLMPSPKLLDLEDTDIPQFVWESVRESLEDATLIRMDRIWAFLSDMKTPDGSKLRFPNLSKVCRLIHFLGDNFLSMIVSGTNEYAEQKVAHLRHSGRLTAGSRGNKWKPVSVEEMRAVLAIVINMGVLSSPDLEGYWRTSWESYIPFFHDVMGRNRFQ